MPDSRLVHIVAMASAERAELARACYALEYHAEIYASYDELIGVAPDRGLVIAEDVESSGGITELVAGMDRQKFWLPVVWQAITRNRAGSSRPSRLERSIICPCRLTRSD